jgi:hypothetical protein
MGDTAELTCTSRHLAVAVAGRRIRPSGAGLQQTGLAARELSSCRQRPQCPPTHCPASNRRLGIRFQSCVCHGHLSLYVSYLQCFPFQVAYPALFLSFQFLISPRTGTDAVPLISSELAVIEALKLAYNVLIQYRSGEGLFRKPQGRTVLWDATEDVEEQPLQGLADQSSDESVASSSEDISQETGDAILTTRSCLAVACASAVWAGAAYTVRGLTDQTRKSIRLECTSHSFPPPSFSMMQ